MVEPKICRNCIHKNVCEICNTLDLKDAIMIFDFKCEDFLTADVEEVKHGEWEKRNFIIFDSEKVGYRCSECNTTWDTNTNYCPSCGAKMDGKQVTE